ncbi:MAG: hypothetical protein IKQ22_00905 [Clostridia bacterium]|nr:hypothetical protein [Clostridia bacterium]
MTDELKKQLQTGLKQMTDSMFSAVESAFDMVEKEMPESLTTDQKQQIFTQIFNSCFETQKKLLEATMSDVKNKMQDKEFMATAMKEVNNG